MMLPTDAAMTTRRSSLSGTLAARIGLLCSRSVRSALWRAYHTESTRRVSYLLHRTELLLLLVLGLELGHNRWVCQGRGVAERPALGDVPQQAAHDLAAARLGQLGRKDDVVRARERADLLGDVRLELVHQLRRAVDAALHGDERRDRLPLDVVHLADDRGLGDRLVIDQGRFHFHRGDAVAGDVHDVVDAAEKPEVAVLVALGSVAGEVDVVVLRPILLHESVGIAPDAPQHPGPRLAQHQVARLRRVALFVEHLGVDARERERGGAGLERGETGQRRDEDVARLSLPPRIDYRTTASADDLPVPNPRLWIDRFTDGSEQPETREIAPLRELLAPLHEGSDGSGRRVADRDAVLLDDAPESVLVRVVGRALVHDGRRAVRQGPVHDVGVAGNPADVGGAPVDVAVVQIEDPLVGRAD